MLPRHPLPDCSGTPSLREGDVIAVWISLEPETPSYERDKGPGGFTASMNTIAWLHGIGELSPTPIVFSHPGRRQTRRNGLSFIDRELEDRDVTVVSGVPATTPARTVLDLARAGGGPELHRERAGRCRVTQPDRGREATLVGS